MPIFRLGQKVTFPDPRLAESPGIIAVGGDLRPERLLEAYRVGIFPWFEEGTPILWWSPDPRLVLDPQRLHVPRSLAKKIRRSAYDVRVDTAFRSVIERCAAVTRPGQAGTWITPGMVAAYTVLFEMGWAHSAEAWYGSELVGGLYGVALGGIFFGESMFADRPDASKVAFVSLVRQLAAWGFSCVDCQQTTVHLLRFGAFEVSRDDFLAKLAGALAAPTRQGRWRLEL